MNKKGITGLSLTIYCILFFVFTAFVVTTTSGFTSQMYSKKGEAINLTQFDKLNYAMRISENESNSVFAFGTNTVSYSNEDVYVYDSAAHVVRRNGAVYVENVSSFEATQITDVGSNVVTVTITFNRFLQETTREIITYAGR